MSSVYIFSEIGKLSKCDEHFIFKDTAGGTTRILPSQTDLIFADRHISITGEAFALLSKHRIPVIFRPYGAADTITLQYEDSKNVFLRQKQYRILDEREQKLRYAKAIARGKMKNQLAFLQKIKRASEDVELRAKYENAANGIKAVLKQAEGAESVDALRGFEGIASRHYFSVFGLHVKPEWAVFEGRSKNPPESNVNAALSFLYTLLSQSVTLALKAQGLDCMVGVLHELSYGKNALVFDMIEEFRSPVADAVCYTLFNENILKEDDFRSEENAVYLAREGLKKVVRQFEAKLCSTLRYNDGEKSYRELLVFQAERYKDAVLTGTEYEPFAYK